MPRPDLIRVRSHAPAAKGVGIAMLALSLLLNGCTLSPDYQRPDVETPSAYRYEPKAAAATANTAWWQQFGDPVLDELIETALANNYNVQIAAANVEQAIGIVTRTRSALYPQFGYGASGEKLRTPDTGLAAAIPNFPNTQETYQALLSASWELDLWGRIRSLSEATQANMLATEEARRGVILTLVSSVASSYITLRGLDEQLAISQRTLATYGESARLYELQFKYGQTSLMTVAQTQSQYEIAAAQIPLIESQIAQVENALSVLLGRNPGPIPRGKPIAQLTAPAVPAGLPSELLERRPDLLQAEQQLIAANAQIGAAKAQYFPTISLTGAYGSASSSLSDLFKGSTRTWNYAGQVVGPIFTFGAVSGQVAQAEAAQQAALASYKLAVQSAFADVDNALVTNLKVGEQLAAQRRLVAALSDYERLANLQYDGGYVPYSTVLQAQQTLFPAELTLAALRASALSSAANIYKAMGGGWIDEADKLVGTPAPAVEDAGGMPPLF
ncbi:MAG: efflux transporter outer membrane subunit [Halioglobus sp.]|nr:efflux transporter outer membrane subunit [Halioglobus sp.]MCB1729000.1 efflux transporter outer membrane subunit [Halieaceae bacterium]